jgi:DNA excision repair protein ERCC-2
VDEAHNLPDRARAMYSAELDKEIVLKLQRTLKPHAPALAKKLGEINKLLLEKRKACQAEGRHALVDYELPEALIKAVREFSHKAEDWLVIHPVSDFRQELLEFYFLCSNFLRTAEYFDTYYISYFERRGQSDLRARLFCLDPAPMLAVPLERSAATVFFSATLLPMNYFKKLLTGITDHASHVFESPFPQENACLLIHNKISTKYTQRADSYAVIAEVIETVVNTHKGNYLVYFPSYLYLNEVLERLRQRFSERQLLIQERGMNEAARDSFLEQFSSSNEETLVGFAVMGGVFGEGIDLVGERLIGVVVVGVGVPQLGLERDLIKEYFEREMQSGYAYAYQYPGFNRVLQATGRVIRTDTDQGVIVLIDERFTHAHYRQLYPSHWRGYQVVKNTQEIKDKLLHFWSQK